MVALGLVVFSFAVGCKGNLKSSNCTPECSNKECGPDNCGGTCGACGPGTTCDAAGQCVSSFCGNGRLDSGEECDFAIAAGNGACETGCTDDGNVCTNEQFFGTPQDCDATCTRFTIIDCINDDGCCPAGCTTNDSDCSLTCGDGVQDENEFCDPPDTCPMDPLTDCPDDDDACTTPIVTGNAAACAAQCGTEDIEDCIDDDGCCPTGCVPPDAGGDDTDTDCDSVCGDGLVTGMENCDSAIPAGDMGACPADPVADCPDPGADPCMVNEIVGMAADCTAVCNILTIDQPADNDGCCPAGATPGNDNDCQAVCGNNIVEAGETCDNAIPAGDQGACPVLADCDDNDACTTDALNGDAAQCTAECANTDVMLPTAADGCCYFAGSVMQEIVDCQSFCDDYCTAATTLCNDYDGAGTNLFDDLDASGDAMDECQAACAAFDFQPFQMNSVNPVDDDGFNTLFCRIYHLELAVADAATHCPHATPAPAAGICDTDP